MLIFNRQADLKNHLKSFSTVKTTIGFVPTMGALHQGHLSLIQKSLAENKITVVSIFVNPTQFNNPEDLAKYPRTLESDVKKLQSISDNIIVYAPSVEDVYQGNAVSRSFNFDGLENQMEGRHRPGHFDGVGTVVRKLFEIIQPTKAYFGEKDFQQLQIVKKLVQKGKLPLEVVGLPIFREGNGLAMSSRNERLTAAEKEQASVIYKVLTEAKKRFATKSITQISNWVVKSFKNQNDFSLEYFEIADEATLKPAIRKIKNKKYRAFIAVFVNGIRLIDTVSLN